MSILDLGKYIDKKINVKFNGGREVCGVLKGYDTLVNLVLDDAIEYIRDDEDPTNGGSKTRVIGLTVCRGNAVMLICPTDGFEEIANPFVDAE